MRKHILLKKEHIIDILNVFFIYIKIILWRDSASFFIFIPSYINISDAINSVSVSSGPSFEEEPSDSFIVRTKSAILRCKTLNALKAWFSCNTGATNL
jgi:hypothetical protein